MILLEREPPSLVRRLRRRAAGLLGACAYLVVAATTLSACSSSFPEAAERLAEARAELESIAQAPSPAEIPPAPAVPGLGLTADERRWVEAVARSGPETWTDAERQRLGAIVAEHREALESLGARAERMSTDQLLKRSPPVIRAARLLSVSNRLDLVEGREDDFLAGVETCIEIAEDLAGQPGVPGSLLANAVFHTVVEDVHLALASPRSSVGTLDRLATALDDWAVHHPSPAAVFAQEMLPLTDPATHPGEPLEDLASFAEEAARVARTCGEGDCGSTMAAFVEPDEESVGEDPGVPDFLWPNLANAIMKLETVDGLTRVARVALEARLQAEETGHYLDSLDGMEAVGAKTRELPEIDYTRSADGGASLRVADARFAAALRAAHRRDFSDVLSWSLPSV